MILWAWGALEADFQRYYHTDLLHLAFANQITVRRFFTLVSHLPGESAFAAFYENKQNRSFAEYDGSTAALR